MSPAEDAALLLAIVRRHLVVLRLGLGAGFPDEEWVFLAQQAAQKLLKAQLVLDDRSPPRSHDLRQLARTGGADLPEALLELQVFAVEARYEEGPFPRRLPRRCSSSWEGWVLAWCTFTNAMADPAVH
jgi:HEPN domain-containing protein